jgi:hypothetical protein
MLAGQIVATDTVIRFRARPEDIERADRLARDRGLSRSELLRGLLAEANSGRLDSGKRLTDNDLVALLEARAQAGHIPAIELLLKRADAHAADEKRERERDARRRAWVASSRRAS